jgi:hypothetical protein
LFFTQEWTPHILRFDFLHTVIIPAAPQETVEEAGIEPENAVLYIKYSIGAAIRATSQAVQISLPDQLLVPVILF